VPQEVERWFFLLGAFPLHNAPLPNSATNDSSVISKPVAELSPCYQSVDIRFKLRFKGSL
jgi:hypothetical protein